MNFLPRQRISRDMIVDNLQRIFWSWFFFFVVSSCIPVGHFSYTFFISLLYFDSIAILLFTFIISFVTSMYLLFTCLVGYKLLSYISLLYSNYIIIVSASPVDFRTRNCVYVANGVSNFSEILLKCHYYRLSHSFRPRDHKICIGNILY